MEGGRSRLVHLICRGGNRPKQRVFYHSRGTGLARNQSMTGADKAQCLFLNAR